jgi:hypothetical protein
VKESKKKIHVAGKLAKKGNKVKGMTRKDDKERELLDGVYTWLSFYFLIFVSFCACRRRRAYK